MNTIIAFLGPIGGPEMFLIFMVLLLLFGAKKLPQLARGIGKSVGEFRKAREEFEDEIRKGGEELDNEVKKSDDDKVSKAPGAEPRTES
ncbi:MAG: twin-arginine translocase TatA/TatE family subunit [Akkermansiaceae bacterium]|mgnify:FL=1|jgi:sec-independent protein translocase protein TatA|nr:twin-arginine translocase TatA/TatE family subunit [Akkermansiaceae bacterium]RZN90850.1 MAG: twin-arginine translocase TatA/TatE family subunit [Verrucomicrobiaceae bacterium]HBF16270.1 twin-arginine translocase TatA/TatE family subunit [Verrucomicrobiales bacterium]MDB4629146.1 twin-arginine translocase TatA/TatE family subunit [Akkermansiaceae bacterium]MDB4784032.1 twin-arginine translocase TatA/TatE family subunit [Akkermansiaceae bacterium]|tara:strand:- start:2778 stop:3044 length:267 start_codon:yes stop_codon:yes gene_type:complete